MKNIIISNKLRALFFAYFLLHPFRNIPGQMKIANPSLIATATNRPYPLINSRSHAVEEKSRSARNPRPRKKSRLQ